jgi:UDP-glucose 4-epimerase
LRVLVTGGAGFIGRQTVRRLVERGDEITVIDLKPAADEGVRHVQGDIRSPDDVARALSQGTDAVIHLAALTRVLDSMNDPDGTFRTNVYGTHLLLERARVASAGCFVLASTNAVVGDVGTTVINEKVAVHPLTPYGATKAAGEMLMSAYSASYGLKTTVLRFTNVYGKGMQQKDSVIPRLMRAALSGGGIQVYGDGEQVRDYVYISDVVQSIELAMALPRSDLLTIGSGMSVSMNELHRIACEVTGIEIGKQHVPAKPGEMPAVIVDNSHATGLGWRPQHDIRSGLAETWHDFEANTAAS